MAKMDRFQAVLIEKARTPKVRELEEEFAAEVKESGNIEDSSQNTAQAQGSDRHKLLRARREAQLANLIVQKPPYQYPCTLQRINKLARDSFDKKLSSKTIEEAAAEIAQCAEATVSELSNRSFQLSTRWRRFAVSKRHRTAEDFDKVSHKYRSTLADTRQELGHAKHVKEHLQSFLDATLVGEQWKGTLRSNDVHLWTKHECLQAQLNTKLSEVRLKLKNLPLQKMIVEKPKRSRDRNKSSRLSDRIVGRNAKSSPPEALDPLRFCQEKILRFFDEEDTVSMFYRDTQSLAESSPRRISMAKDDFLPFLRTLLRRYDIEMPEQLRTAADELELFTSTHQKFRKIHQEQNEQFVFLNIADPSYNKPVLKQTDWPTSLNDVLPSQMATVRSFALLIEKDVINRNIEALSEFAKIRDPAKVTSWYKKCIEDITFAAKQSQVSLNGDGPCTPRKQSIPKDVSERRKKEDLNKKWLKTLNACLEPEKTVQDNPNYTGDGAYDFIRSYQMLGLSDGTDAEMKIKSSQKDASIGSGAYLSFLHLRFLELRRFRYLSLCHFNYIISTQRTCKKLIEALQSIEVDKLDQVKCFMDFYDREEIYGSTVMSVKDYNGHPVVYQAALDKLDELEHLIIALSSNYTLKNSVNVDYDALLHDIWAGTGEILAAKGEICEILLDAVFNATSLKDLENLSQHINHLLTADFFHDLGHPHSKIHMLQHLRVLHRKLTLLRKQRTATVQELRNINQLFNSENDLGPKMALIPSFDTSSLDRLQLFEINPMIPKIFEILHDIENAAEIEFNTSSGESTVMQSSQTLVNIYDAAIACYNVVPKREDQMSYAMSIQKDLLSFKFAPEALVKAASENENLKTPDLINLHKATFSLLHLRNLANETFYLNNNYIGIAETLGFSKSHLFLRLAQPSLGSGQDRPEVLRGIRSVPPDERAMDRFRPGSFSLAAQDFDDTLTKGLTFSSLQQLLHIAQEDKLLNKLEVTVKIQHRHNQLLQLCCQACEIMATWEGPTIFSDTRENGEKLPGPEGTVSMMDSGTVTTATTALGDGMGKAKHAFADSFLSIQWERQWVRSKYNEAFSNASGSQEKVRQEALKVLLKVLDNVIDEIGYRVTIIKETNRLLWLIRNQWEGDYHSCHFTMGTSLKDDPEQVDVMTVNGPNDLWKLSHYSTILNAGRKLKPDELLVGLEIWSTKISSLADIIGLWIGQSRLGQFGVGEKGAWGGAEGIHQNLLELRRHLDKIEDPQQSKKVLVLSRQQFLLENELSIEFLRERFVKRGLMRRGLDLMNSFEKAFKMVRYPTEKNFVQPWKYFETCLGQIIAPLERTDVHNAHAETLSVSVLVEDAIIDCESTIGIRRQNAERGVAKFFKLIGKVPVSITKSKPSLAQALSAFETHDGSITDRLRAKDKLAIFQPDEALEFTVLFLTTYMRLIPLKARWGARKLKVGSIYQNPQVLQEFERVFRNEILMPLVRKLGETQNVTIRAPKAPVVIDDIGQIYKLLHRVSRLEIMVCEISKLMELEYQEAIQQQRAFLKQEKKSAQEGAKIKPVFWFWLDDLLQEHGLSKASKETILRQIEREWGRVEKQFDNDFQQGIKDIRGSDVDEISYFPDDNPKFKMLKLHQDQANTIHRLQQENASLKSELNDVREDERAKAKEHFRPLVTAQYQAMLQMAARLNFYQNSIHNQLMSLVQGVKENTFSQIANNETRPIAPAPKSYAAWNVLKQVRLRKQAAASEAKADEIEKSSAAKIETLRTSFQKLRGDSLDVISSLQGQVLAQNRVITKLREEIPQKSSVEDLIRPSTTTTISRSSISSKRRDRVDNVKNELIAEYEKQIIEKDERIERLEKEIRELKFATSQLQDEKTTALKQTSRMLEVERELKLEAYENVKRLYSQVEQLEESAPSVNETSYRQNRNSTAWNQRQRKLSQFNAIDYSALRKTVFERRTTPNQTPKQWCPYSASVPNENEEEEKEDQNSKRKTVIKKNPRVSVRPQSAATASQRASKFEPGSRRRPASASMNSSSNLLQNSISLSITGIEKKPSRQRASTVKNSSTIMKEIEDELASMNYEDD